MYVYADLRPKLFTEENQALFLKIRDKARDLLSTAGAFKLDHVIRGCSGDSWTMIACVDRLVEIGELREVTGATNVYQSRIFIHPRD